MEQTNELGKNRRKIKKEITQAVGIKIVPTGCVIKIF